MLNGMWGQMSTYIALNGYVHVCRFYRKRWSAEMAQDPRSRKMFIQLLEGNDPSAEADRSAIGRWGAYLDSYVLRQPTEWMPERRPEEEGRSALFLRKWVSPESGVSSLANLMR